MDKDNKISPKKNKNDVKNLARVIIIASAVFAVLVAAVLFFGSSAFNINSRILRPL